MIFFLLIMKHQLSIFCFIPIISALYNHTQGPTRRQHHNTCIMRHPSPVTVSKPASQQRTPDFVLVSLTRYSFKGIVRLKRGRMPRFFMSYAAAAGPLCSLHLPEFEWDRWEEWRQRNRDGVHMCVCVQGATCFCYRSVSRKQWCIISNVPATVDLPTAPLWWCSPHLIRQNNRWGFLFWHFFSVHVVMNEYHIPSVN